MWFRAPDVERSIVLKNKSTTAHEALGRHATFTTLCMRWDVSIVRTKGQMIVIKGRPRKVERFLHDFTRLSEAGAV